MIITKEDVNNLLAHFQQNDWINEEEATEIREYLFELADHNELDALMLEACFDIDWMICSPSYLWETLEKIWEENDN